MHNLGFYIKLCFSNFRRNKSTFIPYLIACSTSVGSFFSMLALTLNPDMQKIPGAGSLLMILGLGCIILAIFCSILIFYTNGFLIKRRKKELGLYSILGMSKANLVILLFFESLFTSLLSLIAGLLGGSLLTRLFFLLLLQVLQMPSSIAFSLQPVSFIYTALFFIVIFGLTFLVNILQIRLANPINLMSSSNKGEKEPRAFWPLTVIGVLALAGGYFIALYYTRPLEALLMFFVAVLLVILGTYCLFTSGSIALLKHPKKRKSYYYTPQHFISTSNMIYRMKQNAAGLATICILSCMVLSVVATTASLYAGTEDSVATNYPHEVATVFYDSEQNAQEAEQKARQLADELKMPIKTLQKYKSAITVASTPDNEHFASEPFTTSLESLSTIEFITLDAYNTIEGKNEVLNEGEVLLFGKGNNYTASSITINGTAYALRTIESFGGIKNGASSSMIEYTIVVPSNAAFDAIAQEIERVQNGNNRYPILRYNLNLDFNASESEVRNFATLFNNELTASGHEVYLASRYAYKAEFFALYGSFLFLGIFVGILFTLATTLIIYYKQISEGYDDHKRFEILQKVGMSEGEVKKTINSQIKTVFYLPLIVAFIHIAFAFTPISRALVVFGISNTTVFLIATGLVMLLYALIYTLIYRATSKSYYKLVQWNR
ncbi:MAG: FtsX-like permease family protein [Oscillospiraceae bacterium]